MPLRRQPRRAVALALGCALALAGSVALPAPQATARRDDTTLYLVTLSGSGSAGSSGLLPRSLRALQLLGRQDATLDGLGAPAPVYRWTTALDGYAVRLTVDQADLLRSNRDVVSVEADSVRPLAALPSRGPAGVRGAAPEGPTHGGAGTVIGLVDSGLAPESPLFAQVRARAGDLDFVGACSTGPDWESADCNGKVVGARWFVDGFGADHVRAAESLSPRDTDGHGTQMASIAAGDSGVSVRVAGERLGRYGGQAPQAHLAVYKACWSAPDPTDDGCSSADLVTAIDQATADGVDVLGLAVGGDGGFDTVERALLGAAEDGVVVVAAAGNGTGSVAHPGPWVTTVGATTGDLRRGRVVLPGGRRLVGAMLSRRDLRPTRVVLAAKAPAAGHRAAEARICAPGSLDARRVEGAIVICRRGTVGRVDKSEAVALADGAAMVLVNAGRGSVDADAHRVPTVHLAAAPGARLVRWASHHPGGRVRLQSLGVQQRRARVAGFSASGSPRSGVLKPDVLAPGSGVLGAVPGGWDFVTGTSAATAYVAGVAATLLSRGDRTPAQVRSALATTAAPVPGGVLRTGSGRVRPDAARSPGLAYLVPAGAYRSWLDGDVVELNTPSAVLLDRDRRFTRTVTSLVRRRETFTASVRGLRADAVVRPSTLTLRRGERARFSVRVTRHGSRLDDGYVVWRGSRGTITRIPVVLAR